jgi:hypothetical protein
MLWTSHPPLSVAKQVLSSSSVVRHNCCMCCQHYALSASENNQALNGSSAALGLTPLPQQQTPHKPLSTYT